MKAGQIIQMAIRDGINSDEPIWGPDIAEFRPERWPDEETIPCSQISSCTRPFVYIGDAAIAILSCSLVVAYLPMLSPKVCL